MAVIAMPAYRVFIIKPVGHCVALPLNNRRAFPDRFSGVIHCNVIDKVAQLYAEFFLEPALIRFFDLLVFKQEAVPVLFNIHGGIAKRPVDLNKKHVGLINPQGHSAGIGHFLP